MTENTTPHILIVDDDERLRQLIEKYLEKNDFDTMVAHNAEEARALIDFFLFDAIVLDVMMPGEDGFSLGQFITNEYPHDLPILYLTAKGEVSDRLEGLEKGAEDYLTKPFEPKELVLRLQTILKRRLKSRPQMNRRALFQNRFFNKERSILQPLDDSHEPIRLTQTESQLLSYLLEKKLGEVVSREALAEVIGQVNNPRTVDVTVTRLRKKIETNPKEPLYLQTVRGEGYCLKPDFENDL